MDTPIEMSNARLDLFLENTQLFEAQLRKRAVEAPVDVPTVRRDRLSRLKALHRSVSRTSSERSTDSSSCQTPDLETSISSVASLADEDIRTPPEATEDQGYFPPTLEIKTAEARFLQIQKAEVFSVESTTPSCNVSIMEEKREEVDRSNTIVSEEPTTLPHIRLRAASYSTPSATSVALPQQAVLKRTASFPTSILQHASEDSHAIFTPNERRKDLVLPHGPAPLEPAHIRKSPAQTDAAETETSLSSPAVETVIREDESSQLSTESKSSIWNRTKASFVQTYIPTESPPLILPSPPTDKEKPLYLSTNRIPLYSFGVFSFLSLSTGMWLFVLSSYYFYWFGAVVFLLQLYLFISYGVSLVGKDYDYKNHKKILQENAVDFSSPSTPSVDVYLPCCKEPIEILENTYRYVQKMAWAQDKITVHVLDDGASDAVKTLASQYGFQYICRDDRPRLKKAGNLRWAFARTSADFFVIFDADFCPREDFLQETIPLMLANPKTAIVQTPQFFRTSDNQSWIEQGAGAVQELFYRVVQVNRDRWGASICVGSNALYRREALIEVGGTAEIGFSEDVHTGFYATDRGWRVQYLPLCLACGICPDTPRAFFSQQMRWCMGSTTLLTNRDFWKSNLTAMQKLCYLSGMMYYSAISLSIFVTPLPGICLIWARPEYVRYYNLAFAIPSLIYSLIAIRCWAKASYGLNVQHIMYLQSFAYFSAIKDRIFGRGLAWVPSGDTKSHKNNKYRNMRILAWCWTITVIGATVAGMVYQILRGLKWYDCVPLICLDVLNLYIAHRFLLWSGKI